MKYPCLLTKKINEISSSKYNPRKITDEAMGRLTKSLAEFGNIQPITWNVRTGNVVGGHQRLKVYKAMGKTEVDVWAVDLDEQKEKAANIALNKLSGEFDMPMLKDILEEIDTGDLDMEITGFGMDEIALMMEDAHPEITEDEVPEVPVDAITKPGDLWLLGEHRVLCGDSTKAEDVAKLMNGEKADMVFTDPPYGMDLDTDYTKMGDGGKRHDKVIDDNKQFNAQPLLKFFNYCDEIFLWGADYYIETINRQYPNLGSWIIWDKYSDSDRMGLLDGRFGSSFETCWSKSKHKREIARVLVTTNYTSRGDETRIHPTQKPVALVNWFFDRWAKQRNNIVDLFLGSGSTLMACEQASKICFGMELDPKYCDVIVKRWENLTGKKATLAK